MVVVIRLSGSCAFASSRRTTIPQLTVNKTATRQQRLWWVCSQLRTLQLNNTGTAATTATYRLTIPERSDHRHR